MNERIKKARKALGLTQAEFASRIGSVQNTITGYETGRRVPSNQVLSLICREFNVNEDWLRTGEGEMFQPKPKDELDEILTRHGIPPEFRALAESFLDMKPEEQQAITAYMQKVAAAISSGSLSGVPLSVLKAESYAAGQSAAQAMAAAEPADQRAAWEAEAREVAEMAYQQFLDEKRAEAGYSASQPTDYGDLLA